MAGEQGQGNGVRSPRRRIVVGVDRSPGSRRALRHAVAEALWRGADVEVIATFSAALPWTSGSLVPDPERLHRETLARTEDFVAAVGAELATVPAITVDVVEGPAADVLLQRAAGAELLVVGRHGHGAVRTALIGSVALRCLGHAAGPVEVVPLEDAAAPTGAVPRVVVGVDGSPESRAALATAVQEAGRLGAEVDVVAVCEGSGEWNDLATTVVPSYAGVRADVQRGAAAMVEAVLAGVERPVRARIDVVDGSPSDVLVERARGAALLVLGNHGRSGLGGRVLGSVALRCAVAAPCPVLLVPARERAPHEGRAAHPVDAA